MFFVHSSPEKFENAIITGHFRWICVWEKLGEENHMIIVDSVLSKSFVSKMFSVHIKARHTLGDGADRCK